MVTFRFARRIIICLLLVVILWIPAFAGMTIIAGITKVAYAADEFATSYDVVYDVGSDGITTVTEKVTLKNLTSQYYATQFSLTIGATEIFDVSASDPSGPLEVKQEAKGSARSLLYTTAGRLEYSAHCQRIAPVGIRARGRTCLHGHLGRSRETISECDNPVRNSFTSTICPNSRSRLWNRHVPR